MDPIALLFCLPIFGDGDETRFLPKPFGKKNLPICLGLRYYCTSV